MEELAELFKALSNKHRLIIFHELLHREGLALISDEQACCCHPHGEGCCCVGELGRKVALAPSTISHHIKELKNAGLIDVRREGSYLYCSVNKGTWLKLLSYFR
jgi:ArsR family transcriptional regulator